MRETLLAFAKLNLCLAVRGRRADGFHEIESIVQTVDLADHIDIDVRPGAKISVENTLAGVQGPDLAERAAVALLARKGTSRDVRVRIRKGIPAGAGLGGGSSDAAAVLGSVNRLAPPNLGRDALVAVAAEIGSDVVLFLDGGRARITGRGEIVEPLSPVRPEVFVVVVPPIHCATADVYATWATHCVPRSAAPPLGSNDLLPAALAVHPELRRYQAAVARRGLFSGMSGSGSSFYVAFDETRGAATCARELRQMLPESRVFVCSGTSVGSRSCGMEDS